MFHIFAQIPFALMVLPRTKKWNISLIIFLGFLHLSLLLTLLWYQSQIKVFSRVSFYSGQKFCLSYTTPTGCREMLTANPQDTVTLPFRPVSQVFLAQNGKTREITASISCAQKEEQKTLSDDAAEVHFQVQDRANTRLLQTAGFLAGIMGKTGKLFLFGFYCLVIVAFILINRQKAGRNLGRMVRVFYRKIIPGTEIRDLDAKAAPESRIRLWIVLSVVGILFVICIFSGLGKKEFMQTEHEPLRALVALEMKLSGQYIVPTKMGEPYLNKPPLFHWIIASLSDDTHAPEAKLRAVSMSFILLTAFIIFGFVRKLKGLKIAVPATLLYIGANGVFGFRQLQIDQFFAFLCVLLFFLNYYYASQKRFIKLFLYSYLIVVFGFLTKGFVIFWFEGVSLVLALYVNRSLKKILSWQHLAGFAACAGALGVYFYLYGLQADPWAFFKQQILEDDSITGYTMAYRIRHFLLFPLKNIYYYLPAFAFLPVLFTKGGLYEIHKNPLYRYLFYLALIATFVFWISPSYASYYILMFIPAITVLIAANLKNIYSSPLILKSLYVILCSMLLINNIYFGITTLMILVVFLFFKAYQLEILSLALCINMVGFVFFGPESHEKSSGFDLKIATQRIVNQYKDHKILVFDRKTQVQDAVLFYFTFHKGEIIKFRKGNVHEGDLYLINRERLNAGLTVVDSVRQMTYSQQEQNRTVQMQENWLYVAMPCAVKKESTGNP